MTRSGWHRFVSAAVVFTAVLTATTLSAQQASEAHIQELIRAAAQQAAHANEQQPPTQFLSEAGSVPDSFHCACSSDAGDDDRSASWDAVWS